MIKVRTTNKTRTYDTAFYQLRNLYYSLNPDEVDELIQKDTYGEDLLLDLDIGNCKLLKHLDTHVRNSE